MAQWWSTEVFSGAKLPASGWRYAYEDELTEAAITPGARYYEWRDSQYGVIFKVPFPGAAALELAQPRSEPQLKSSSPFAPGGVNHAAGQGRME